MVLISPVGRFALQLEREPGRQRMAPLDASTEYVRTLPLSSTLTRCTIRLLLR